MCGIVGLYLKSKSLEPQLGAMLAQMLGVMNDRGPDSAGFAVYGSAEGGHTKMTLRSDGGAPIEGIAAELSKAIGRELPSSKRGSHLVLTVPNDEAGNVRDWLSDNRPGIRVVGSGHRMELYKEVGLPSEVAVRFSLDNMSGTHAIGHTRMATESAGDQTDAALARVCGASPTDDLTLGVRG